MADLFDKYAHEEVEKIMNQFSIFCQTHKLDLRDSLTFFLNVLGNVLGNILASNLNNIKSIENVLDKIKQHCFEVMEFNLNNEKENACNQPQNDYH